MAAAHGAPANTTYDVEVLVFETTLPTLEGSELWTRDRMRATIPEIAEAITIGEKPSGNSNLSTVAAALERDGSYRILTHQHWQQTAEAKSAVKPVRLRNTDGQVDGALRFYMSRFLHVDLDLVLREKNSAAENVNYRISEHRRVKTQEVNYFDHPKFGVLVRITSAGKE